MFDLKPVGGKIEIGAVFLGMAGDANLSSQVHFCPLGIENMGTAWTVAAFASDVGQLWSFRLG